jgi:hypothetical protein
MRVYSSLRTRAQGASLTPGPRRRRHGRCRRCTHRDLPRPACRPPRPAPLRRSRPVQAERGSDCQRSPAQHQGLAACLRRVHDRPSGAAALARGRAGWFRTRDHRDVRRPEQFQKLRGELPAAFRRRAWIQAACRGSRALTSEAVLETKSWSTSQQW